ncbi:MAG: ABC transporter ATP-binding protein [Planctomycetota bacterium]|jgi:multiple sugar transport system ATP-binding protein
MAQVFLKNVTKVFDGNVVAVNNACLEIADKEFMVIVGPSGCGKTTMLRLIAGLEELTAGNIKIGEEIVDNVPPKDRDIAMVFQNYALYPHMTVFQNMAFGLKLRKVPKTQIKERVINTAEMLGIEKLLDRKPRALSGGQRQRVALGRAIVRKPKAFLFDEPLSNLDMKLRVTTRAELKALHYKLQRTSIYVTHDQAEAMTLSDRICVMYNGQIQQVDEPMEVYDKPVNKFVAGFFGMVPNNHLTLGVRPENLSTKPYHGNSESAIAATVKVIEPLGDRMDVYLESCDGSSFIVNLDPYSKMRIGEKVRIYIDMEKSHIFEAGKMGKNVGLSVR